ncbi:MAG TPA: metallophosphoesterase [Bacillota bacterium]|nr:metallophosphoesterase [Bacillota bacterium]
MKIIVISDTHGNNILNTIRRIDNVDVIIHLGDYYTDILPIKDKLEVPVHYVKGNCDFAPEVPAQLLLELSNKRVFISHGHWFNVKLGLDELIDKAIEKDADLVLYGHTHVADISMDNGIIFLNPGSASIPNGDDFTTIGIINIQDNKIKASIKTLEELNAVYLND